MALKVRFVENLRDILDPVVEYLTVGSTEADLFTPQRLIVPTAGVRAWLAPQVAARLGATAGNNDGVLANVRIGYIGMLNGLLRAGIEDEDDAWSIERVTMAVLRVIHGRDASDPLIRKHGGHLRAARAIADRFDRYAARRPALIREWEAAHRTNAEVGRDNAQAEWQF
ncbi:MAG: putative RecC protein, partial [Actinomycetota bacterium]